ncbi:hypothetical protein FOMG_18403 [Fusarium oxysporum f. sp. melonis 26406]|uniref:Uncharacterized protein n=1 Tax=Fusarium oxysporum f. sp. melonis 26406 TaxID=1089452 RepID=W9Z8E1_FUSOX|nr:hypothetical protein FOMG_18403 [Fusarium oxysporum f. sp. melonis 26406]
MGSLLVLSLGKAGWLKRITRSCFQWVDRTMSSFISTNKSSPVLPKRKSHQYHTTSRHLTESFHHGVYDLA